MMKVEVEIADKMIPDGFEISRIGVPKAGDFYLVGEGSYPDKAASDWATGWQVILRKKRSLRRLTPDKVNPSEVYRGYFTDEERELDLAAVKHHPSQFLFGVRVGDSRFPFLSSTGGRYRYFWVIEE